MLVHDCPRLSAPFFSNLFLFLSFGIVEQNSAGSAEITAAERILYLSR